MSRCGVIFAGDEAKDWQGYARRADQSGFWGLGVGDSPSIYPDLYVQLGAASTFMTNTRIGPWVTNPLTRHPVVTANGISTVDDLTGGRAFFGIGTGFSAALNIGVKPARRQDLEAYIAAVRELQADGETVWDGAVARMRPANRLTPVYVAATGPETLKLAGRIADGVVVGDGITEDVVQSALGYISEGARSVGRSLSDLDIWWLVVANLADTDEQALSETTNSLMSLGVQSSLAGVKNSHVPQDLREPMREMAKRYNAMDHAKFGPSAHSELVEELGLLNYLESRYSIVGAHERFVDRCAEAREAGADKLWFTVRVAAKERFLNHWNRNVRDLVC